jgi:hypothetical protein
MPTPRTIKSNPQPMVSDRAYQSAFLHRLNKKEQSSLTRAQVEIVYQLVSTRLGSVIAGSSQRSSSSSCKMGRHPIVYFGLAHSAVWSGSRRFQASCYPVGANSREGESRTVERAEVVGLFLSDFSTLRSRSTSRSAFSTTQCWRCRMNPTVVLPSIAPAYNLSVRLLRLNRSEIGHGVERCRSGG